MILGKKRGQVQFYGLNSDYNNLVFFFSCSQVTEGFFLSSYKQMKLQENEEELEPDNKLVVEACQIGYYYIFSNFPLWGHLIKNQIQGTHQWQWNGEIQVYF